MSTPTPRGVPAALSSRLWAAAGAAAVLAATYVAASRLEFSYQVRACLSDANIASAMEVFAAENPDLFETEVCCDHACDEECEEECLHEHDEDCEWPDLEADPETADDIPGSDPDPITT